MNHFAGRSSLEVLVMTNKSNNYREEMDAKRIMQIRSIIRELPQAFSMLHIL